MPSLSTTISSNSNPQAKPAAPSNTGNPVLLVADTGSNTANNKKPAGVGPAPRRNPTVIRPAVNTRSSLKRTRSSSDGSDTVTVLTDRTNRSGPRPKNRRRLLAPSEAEILGPRPRQLIVIDADEIEEAEVAKAVDTDVAMEL
ncbi:hypothetical protein HYPSUDRAFT_210078 [Hypholoma sublateritium FD-334 SS-4]|uniref:Uncharacterized protein n=1 Tax=Hypholoma sublateritium (strain FD-334 SS-4) TaxID=945553 RepID=A0A0D2KE83_HYPSF|nr:hypothetical protein HYPSUDRAFT_210078 [Hypholoma sublateritium FD-334 SS-4]